MDFTTICRICLESNKQTYDIYSSLDRKRNTLFAEMISKCTKLKPFEGDGLPRLICKECCKQLKRTYNFNTQCEDSDTKLRCYLDNKSEIVLNVDVNLPNNEFKSETEDVIENDGVDMKENGHAEVAENDKGIRHKIKFEPGLLENSRWDVDDDNILAELKSKEKTVHDKLDGYDDCCWDAEDDNLLVPMKLKEKSELSEYCEEDEEKPKKKRGRKKKVHVEGELPPNKLPHQCDLCGKFLSTKSNLKAHKLCHTELRPYRCRECPATFRGHSALFQHKMMHSGETPFHCEYCPKRFTRRTGLVNHIRMHTGEKQYSCDICFKSFVQSSQLSVHIKRHKGEKPFLCQDCGKGFPVKADLKVHQRIHNGERPYSCHLCSKTFSTGGNLSIHVRIHNKEIRYHCKECKRGFVTCSSYSMHLKRHKGQRDYQCECGKAFYTSSSLNQHKVVHTGEKRYQCRICDRKFSQKSHLNRHFKRDHAKPNAPVPSSDYYKVVLDGKAVRDDVVSFDDFHRKVDSLAVKCEAS